MSKAILINQCAWIVQLLCFRIVSGRLIKLFVKSGMYQTLYVR